MAERRCKNCKWWDNKHPRLAFAPEVQGVATPGFCRKHKPGAYTLANDKKEAFAIGIQPITDGDESCGEFREEA